MNKDNFNNIKIKIILEIVIFIKITTNPSWSDK